MRVRAAIGASLRQLAGLRRGSKVEAPIEMGALSAHPPILVVTGLLAEARIAAGIGVMTVAGGGDPARLRLLVQAALARGAGGVVSFGIAGGLAPGLAPGDVVIARAIRDGDTRLIATPAWVERLAAALPGAAISDLAGVDAAVVGIDDKDRLHRRSAAAAVDMESHIAARLAASHGLPFVALRVVADPARRSLPPAALVGMRPDGTTDVGAVLRSLVHGPRQLPDLVRTGLDARAAFTGLRKSRHGLAALSGLARLPSRGGFAGLPLDVEAAVSLSREAAEFGAG